MLFLSLSRRCGDEFFGGVGRQGKRGPPYLNFLEHAVCAVWVFEMCDFGGFFESFA